MKNSAHEQRMACFFPMRASLKRALRVDKHICNILNVPHFPLAASYFKQRVIGVRENIGWIKAQHAAVFGAKACSERPVLALNIVNDG